MLKMSTSFISEISTKVGSIQVPFLSRCTSRNLFMLTLLLDYIVGILFSYFQGLQNVFMF